MKTIVTAESVLEKLQEISKRHLMDRPAIGIDSLVLALNVDQNALVPLLIELENKQKLILHRNDKVDNTRNSGRIDDFHKVSLC